MIKILKDMYYKTVSVFIWTVIVLITLVACTTIILLSPLSLIDKKRRIAHFFATMWGNAIIWINPLWDLRVHGTENIDKKKSYVIVSNHQSMGDIIIVYLLWVHFKWISKRSVFQVPILGWAMHLTGYILLDRGRHGSIRDSFKECKKWLERDVSVLIFPEGTRSMSGEIQKFKNGAFRLAIEMKKPILPIVISGTRDAIPKGSWIFNHRTQACVTVLPPIDVVQNNITDHSQLREMVHSQIAEELKKNQI